MRITASLYYIEPRSLRKEITDMLWAWAWTEDPSRIPKVKRVTLPAHPSVVPGIRDRSRRGLRHRVLIHLAIVEHFTTEDANGNPPPPHALPFKLGEVHGADKLHIVYHVLHHRQFPSSSLHNNEICDAWQKSLITFFSF
jgi:hypothetical protein